MEKPKNPKVLAESLSWISESCRTFGIQTLDVKELAKFVISLLGNANQGVRASAVSVVGAIAASLGPDTRFLFKDLPPAQQSVVNTEIESRLTEYVVPATVAVPDPVKSAVLENSLYFFTDSIS